MNTEELLPCPFCGSIPHSEKDWGSARFYIECRNVNCAIRPKLVKQSKKRAWKILWDDDVAEAIAQWNLRPTITTNP